MNGLTLRHIVFIVFIAIFTVSSAQKTTRKGLKLNENIGINKVTYDTVVPTKGNISLSGYEKSQASVYETFFATNNTERTIKAISLDIQYLNTKGIQLHKRTVTLKCDIPPHETRMLNLKAWDRQNLWYYTKTQGRHNDHASPYDIKIHINYIVLDNH